MKIPIEKAIQFAKSNISEIHNVQEWALEMGYSSSDYFSRLFRNYFGRLPKTVLIQIRIKKFRECIESDPDQINYALAREIGLPDDVALSRYIKRHTGKTPTDFKNEMA